VAVAVILAAVAAGCADTPTAPSASGAVSSRGVAPQGGTPEPPGDSLGLVNALGATNYLAFGDSITWGVTSSFDGTFLFDPPPGTGYPEQLDGLLEAQFTTQDFVVANLGAPGEWAVQALSTGRFLQELSSRRPQGLLLLEGINDMNNGRSVSQVVGSLQQMVELARLYNATVLLANMFQTCESTDGNGVVRPNSNTLIVPFNSALSAMAAGRQNVYIVDLYGAFGNNCGPSGGFGLLGGDGLHPSGSGYSVMASRFRDAIRTHFAVRGSFQ
jgi:lysophospholipase L1-like esterase